MGRERGEIRRNFCGISFLCVFLRTKLEETALRSRVGEWE